MSAQTMSIADQFQMLTAGKRSYWSWLMEQDGVVNGLQETRSLSSIVTDSSAASSTWGSGRKIWNGQVNMYPDGTALRTLHDLMRSAGVRTGLVTTTTITHATPAGFAVSCMHRDQQEDIAQLYLKARVDVLMGGGDNFFSAAKRKDKVDLYDAYAKAGYQILRERADLKGVKAKQVLGVFSPSHLPYSVDRDNDPTLTAKVPTLAEMAKAAIENLKDSPKGFLLQIEGGKVDHGGHADDLAAMIYDQIAFEEAVKAAIEFALKDRNTLVVITADHATGGPSLNGAGDEYFDATGGIKKLAGMKASYDPVIKDIGASPTVARVRELIDGKLGVQLTTDEAELVVDAAAKKWAPGLSSFERSINAVLGVVLGNHTKVQWTSLNHTSEHVLVSTFGPGAEEFAGLTPNVKMFDMLLAHKGLKWSNPLMTFEEAARHYEKIKSKVSGSLDEDEDSRLADLHGYRPLSV
jgi:alkaline phosphatase